MARPFAHLPGSAKAAAMALSVALAKQPAVATPGGAPAAATPSGRFPGADPVALADSLINTARYDSAFAVIDRAMTTAEAAADSAGVGRLLTARARAELQLGRTAAAGATVDRALPLAKGAADTTTWMTALTLEGFVHYNRGEAQAARRCHEERLRLARLAGSKTSEAWALAAIAYIALDAGEYARSRDTFAQSAALFRRAGAPQFAIEPLIGLGRAHEYLGQADSARVCWQEALVQAKQFDDPVREAYATNNLGILEANGGHMDLAARYYERAYRIHRRTGSVRGAMVVAVNLGLLNSYLGQYADAAAALEEAIAMGRTSETRDLLPSVLGALGEVRHQEGRHHRAIGLCREALASGDALSADQRDRAIQGLAQSLAGIDSVDAASKLLLTALGNPDVTHSQAREAAMCVLLADIKLQAERSPYDALMWATTASAKSQTLDKMQLRTAAAVTLSRCYAMLDQPAASRASSFSMSFRGETRPTCARSAATRVVSSGCPACAHRRRIASSCTCRPWGGGSRERRTIPPILPVFRRPSAPSYSAASTISLRHRSASSLRRTRTSAPCRLRH